MRKATPWRRPATAVAFVLFAVAGFAQAQPPTQPSAPPAAAIPIPPGPEDRVVVTDMVPVPDVGKGAPYYKPKDIDRMRATTRLDSQRTKRDIEGCSRGAAKGEISMADLLGEEIDYSQDVLIVGSRALRATLAAEEARTIRPGVEVNQQEVIRTELERQVAIIAFDRVRLDLINARAAVADYQELARGNAPVSRAQLMVREVKRMNAGWGVNTLANVVTSDVAIEETSAVKTKGWKGQPQVMVSGLIRNKTGKPLRIPKLTITVLDERGWFLSALPAEPPPRQQIPAGQAIAFQYVLKSIPAAGENLVVGFASELDPPPRMSPKMLAECDLEGIQARQRANSDTMGPGSQGFGPPTFVEP